MLPRESALILGLPAASDTGRIVPKSSRLEEEVIALFDQLRDRLLRYLLSVGLPVQDSEEVIQEAFLALFQHLQRGKSRRNLRGWLFRVAHNLALKRFGSGHAGELPDEATLADPAPSPEDQATSNQTQKRLRAVYRVLPEQDRNCLSLRAEGLRYREIAEVLGISLGAVSLSLARSLERLSRAAER